MVRKIEAILNEKAMVLEKWLRYQHKMIMDFDQTKDIVWFNEEQAQIDNIRMACFNLDVDFLKHLEILLNSHSVSGVEDLPKEVLDEFEPIKNCIQHIQDVEALICEETEAVSHMKHTLNTRQRIKQKYIHK